VKLAFVNFGMRLKRDGIACMLVDLDPWQFDCNLVLKEGQYCPRRCHMTGSGSPVVVLLRLDHGTKDKFSCIITL
jgi:hypothetical protein